MYKERLLTKILLPIFSVILVIVIQLASFLGSAVIIVSNPRLLVSQIINEDVIDIVCEETYQLFGKKIESAIDLSSISEDADEIVDAIYSKDFVKFFLSESIEATLLGDKNYDKKFFKSWLEGINDKLNDLGMSDNDIEKLDEKITDTLKDALNKTSSGSNRVWKIIQKFLQGTVLAFVGICFLISLGIMVILLGILFLVAKNKMLVVKYFGLSMIISYSIRFISSLFTFISMKIVSSNRVILEIVLSALFTRAFFIDLLVNFLLLGLGILIFIIGMNKSKLYKVKHMKKDLYSEVREYEEMKRIESLSEMNSDELDEISIKTDIIDENEELV